MAKTKKKYYRKSFKRYKSVSSNYLRVKVEYMDRIIWPDYPVGDNRAYDLGYCYWVLRGNAVGQDQQVVVTLGDVGTQYSYNASLQALFSYYRPTGIRIEAVPDSRNAALPSSVNINNQSYSVPFPMTMISYRMGSNASQTLGEAKANNQSMVLNSQQKVARYWRVHGATTAYAVTTASFTGAFTVRNEYDTANTDEGRRHRSLMVYRTMPSWSVKISVYYLYKYCKA